MTLIPAAMLQTLTITHAAALGEIALAIAVDQINRDAPTDWYPARPEMRAVDAPTLLEHELHGHVGQHTLEAHDASFTITFGRLPDAEAIRAWIVVEGVAIHSPDAGRTPFAPILCRLRRKRR